MPVIPVWKGKEEGREGRKKGGRNKISFEKSDPQSPAVLPGGWDFKAKKLSCFVRTRVGLTDETVDDKPQGGLGA